MSTRVTADFRFEIGDAVYFKTAEHNLDRRPAEFLIVSRLVEECCGGIQLHYRIGNGNIDHAKWFPENLLSTEMPPFKEDSREFLVAASMRSMATSGMLKDDESA